MTGLEMVRAYHERSKHRLDKYAAHPDSLDWDARPAPFRRFIGAETVPLPPLSELDGALQRALERPINSPGEIEPLPHSLAGLSAVLALSLGVTAWKREGPDRWAVRANPSSGNLHPVEAYVLASGVAGLAAGVYHYRAEDHMLEQRALWSDEAQLDQPRLGIAFTTIMWREAWKYGERAFRYCQLDTGHAVAALRYAAGVLGWQAHEQDQASAEMLQHTLGLDRDDRAPSRRADTEREEPELLLELLPGRGRPRLGVELAGRAAAAEFSGRPSTIDPHPMYSWPVVHEVAAATRWPGSTMSTAPSSPPSPRIRSTTNVAPVASVLLGRRSAQRFDREMVLTRAAFAAILHGVATSAGSRASLDLALFVHRVEGLSPGAYLLPLASAGQSSLRDHLAQRFPVRPVESFDRPAPLLQLATLSPRELARAVRTLHCHQEIASSCCFAVAMLADLDQALARPADYRKLLREAGSLGQTLYVEAEAVGVRGTGIGCFFDDAVAEFLLLRDTSVRSVYHFCVGQPLEDPRIETEAALTLAKERRS